MSPNSAVSVSGPGNAFGVNVPAGYSRTLSTRTLFGLPLTTGGVTDTRRAVAAPSTIVSVGCDPTTTRPE